MTTALDQRFVQACTLAREAGALARHWFEAPDLEVKAKGPQDYVSIADRAVEDFLAARLMDAFPEDSLLGEETGGEISDSLWVVDPIDGTANFVRGLPHFCISIAYVHKGEIEIGVIYAPMTDLLYAARRNGGATRNGQPIRVSACSDMTQAAIEAGHSNRRPNSEYMSLVGGLWESGASVRRCGSGALGMAEVADGRSDGYCELHINAWDVLAGILLVREAGGWTNDFLAGDGLRRGNPILACPPGLAAELRRVTRLA
ncbi:inositol monophosphatase family protein [Telmatospirillum sp. J64-1]|uniref:inositol monophosphatase family protein n=1 Tax=Telmatospirillum sp. J64-1 TaxID=2502183 RepID=UPI00115F1F04|nr:inositol monophosphatase family protein [Telmatospirillum sp. J64-1]